MAVFRLHTRGTCITCNAPFTDLNVFTDAGHRETQISGICELCFDEICNPEEDAE